MRPDILIRVEQNEGKVYAKALCRYGIVFIPLPDDYDPDSDEGFTAAKAVTTYLYLREQLTP